MIRRASPRAMLAAALLLPLIVLAYSWASTYRLAQQGEEWLIPIQGYDPRDLLRGHYVQYRYDWPVEKPPSATGQAEAAFDPAFASRICIEGTAPNISQVRALPFSSDRIGNGQEQGCAIVARATLGARREVRGLDSGILYASQERALSLSRQLADPKQRGFVRVRIRPDGVMRPVDLAFRPRGMP